MNAQPSTSAAGSPEYSGERIAVVNPRTGLVDHHLTAPSRADVQQIAQRLRVAQRGWRDAGLAQRIAVLQRWRAALVAAQADIIAALTVDTGRHLIAISEFQAIPAYIDRWTKLVPQLPPDQVDAPMQPASANPAIMFRSQYVPYSLVGVISPWNFPVALCFIDAIPALLAGCRGVRQAERGDAALRRAARRTDRGGAGTRGGVPDTRRAARDRRGAGRALRRRLLHRQRRHRAACVAENAARHFIPAFLELGGNDPMIVTAER
jgi:succinate-semialdehyde dehydrogenase/glutarate-semialdehyde dehydrogenase